MAKHLVFFDNGCPLCRKAIRAIQERDSRGQFAFFPLNSEMARESLPEKVLREDTMILLEEGKRQWLRAKALFRILKLLGGKYSWLGALAYVPGLDFLYRIVAHNRHLFMS